MSFTASFACIFCLSSPDFLQLDFPPLTTLYPLLFCPSVKAQLDNSSSVRRPLVPAAINALPPTHLPLKMELSRVHHVLRDWYACTFYFTCNLLLRFKGTLFSIALVHARCWYTFIRYVACMAESSGRNIAWGTLFWFAQWGEVYLGMMNHW